MAVRVPVSLTPEEQAALVTSGEDPRCVDSLLWQPSELAGIIRQRVSTLAKTSGGRCNAFGCSDPSGIKIANRIDPTNERLIADLHRGRHDAVGLATWRHSANQKRKRTGHQPNNAKLRL